MDAAEALHLLRILGLSLTATDGRLLVQPSELLDDDARWLIRRYRDEILSALVNDGPARHWSVTFPDFHRKEMHFHPEKDRASVLAQHPNAIHAEQVPDPPKPVWTPDASEAWLSALTDTAPN